MNFVGSEAISRATRATSRSLLMGSVLLYSVKIDAIDVNNVDIFGIKFEEGFAKVALFYTLTFLVVAHLVQWYSDFTSIRGWNISGRSIVGLQYMNDRESKSKLEAVGSDIRNLMESQSNELSSNYKSTLSSIGNLVDDLKKFNRSVWNFGLYAIFYVVVWYLVFPVGVSLLVLYLDSNA